MLSVTMLNVVMLSVTMLIVHFEFRYAECSLIIMAPSKGDN
jgi:hypothetical protein